MFVFLFCMFCFLFYVFMFLYGFVYCLSPCIQLFIINIGNQTRCNSVSEFYFIFIWSSTCFGRHTAHRQEPKTALAASGFAYVEGCWTCSCWTLSGRVWEGAVLLMMGGVSPETCWPSYKYEIKLWCTVASCWISYMYYSIMHGSTNIKFTKDNYWCGTF